MSVTVAAKMERRSVPTRCLLYCSNLATALATRRLFRHGAPCPLRTPGRARATADKRFGALGSFCSFTKLCCKPFLPISPIPLLCGFFFAATIYKPITNSGHFHATHDQPSKDVFHLSTGGIRHVPPSFPIRRHVVSSLFRFCNSAATTRSSGA